MLLGPYLDAHITVVNERVGQGEVDNINFRNYFTRNNKMINV